MTTWLFAACAISLPLASEASAAGQQKPATQRDNHTTVEQKARSKRPVEPRADEQATEPSNDEQTSDVLKNLQHEKISGGPAEGPPPAPPKPGQQEPRPYVAPVEGPGKERHVTLMAVAGAWRHGFDGDTARAGVGPVWGFAGRVDPLDWLGVRLSILRGNQPVTPEASAFVRPGVQLQQPDFEVIHWAIRMEPTWHVTSAFSLWAGVGLAWARAIVPEPTTSDTLRSADRACVYVEGQWALGAQYELIRDWVLLDLDLSTGALGYQKGSAHDPLQAFTPDGHRSHIGGYSDFSRKVQGLFGIGVIL